MKHPHLTNELILTFRGELPSLNKYINVDRTNRFEGARMKRNATDSVHWECKEQLSRNFNTIITEAYISILWICKNKKEDPDNISFEKKYILDGLQTAGVISGDGWKNVCGFEDDYAIDAEDPRVEVTLRY